MDRRTFGKGALGGALLSAISSHAADGYPSRPIKLVVPYAAGGGPDVMVRQLAPKLGEQLGQPLVIENRVGAGGVLAAQYVAQAAGDGYTVLVGSNSHLIQKILQPSLRFDPVGEFIPVTVIGTSPSVLVVAADSPYRTVEDLVNAVKASPGKLSYGSGGIGSAAHLGAATLLSIVKGDAVHVPLKGSVEIPLSLLRGDTDFAFTIAGTAVPQVKGGKLRALGVTRASPMKELPGVVALRNALHSELMVQEFWFGLWAPLKTPVNVIDTLYKAATTALADAGVVAAFEQAGNNVIQSSSPQADAAFVQAENRKWIEIIKLTGVTAS